MQKLFLLKSTVVEIDGENVLRRSSCAEHVVFTPLKIASFPPVNRKAFFISNVGCAVAARKKPQKIFEAI